jgi:hypothetical protein
VQAVGAGAEELEEAEVAEDLELLADFVADMSVFRMELGGSSVRSYTSAKVKSIFPNDCTT